VWEVQLAAPVDALAMARGRVLAAAGGAVSLIGAE
jgi:hypothetical protein